MSNTLDLAMELIRRPSVTPDDAGCQEFMIERLEAMGFQIERMRFGEVDNLWARRGRQPPLFVFAGHTDVVPPGPLDLWHSPPFSPTLRDGLLFGRGAADMKGSLAAMLSACASFLTAEPRHHGSIGFLITSDEEGPAIDGTIKVVETLQTRGEKIDFCLVGEPSSSRWLGDTIKNGRRGSLNGVLTVKGKQGHVAYPRLASNPIHLLAPVLNRLCLEEWDQGNSYFPPTGFQISNINSGTGAENVIPGELQALFNFRYSTELDDQRIKTRVAEILDSGGFNYGLDWRLSGKPFITPEGELTDATRNAVEQVTGAPPRLSTSGGTSDGRFIAPTGAQVVELGPLNESIHQVDERVAVADLERLAQIYHLILKNLLAGQQG